jgi:hypothetical protein
MVAPDQRIEILGRHRSRAEHCESRGQANETAMLLENRMCGHRVFSLPLWLFAKKLNQF